MRGNGLSAGSGQGMMGNATSTVAMTAQRDVMIAQHDAMEKAVLAGDYTAWKVAVDKMEANHLSDMQGKTMTSVITEANFAKFVEMHKLMQQADTIRKELGLDQAGGMGPGMRDGMMRGGRGMGHRFATSAAVTNQ